MIRMEDVTSLLTVDIDDVKIHKLILFIYLLF